MSTTDTLNLFAWVATLLMFAQIFGAVLGYLVFGNDTCKYHVEYLM